VETITDAASARAGRASRDAGAQAGESLAAGEPIAQLAAAAAEATTPLEALRRVTALRRELDAFERRQVARALAEGATFARIARDLGVSRQAAHRRFRDLAAAEVPLVTTPDVRRVLRYAREEAAALGAETPAGEHVVLATLRASDLAAAALLRDMGATLDRARTQAEASSPRAPLFRREAGRSDLRELLSVPAREARERGAHRIEVEHLLLGMLRDEAGGAARMLRALGVDLDAVQSGLATLLDAQPA
jgi:Clp amino terminal domain, pathogenicity island component